jgi:hypothetical protein
MKCYGYSGSPSAIRLVAAEGGRGGGNAAHRKPLIMLKTVLGIRIRNRIRRISMFLGLPDPDPDPFVRVQIRILPFSHKCVEQTAIMPAKQHLTQSFSKKLNFLTEDGVPVGKL